MQEINESVTLRVRDAVIDGNELWAACNDFNGLLYCDLKKNRVELIDSFPGTPLFTNNMFSCTVKMGNILVFVPACAEAIYTYEIEKKEFHTYALPDELMGGKNNYKFIQAFVYKNSVYMIGYLLPCIVRFEVFTGRITCFEEWYQDFVQSGYKNKRMLVDREVCLIGEKIFFPPRNGDCIIEFDMKSQRIVFHDFNYKEDDYYTLCYEGGFFWTYGTSQQAVIQISNKFEVVKEISLADIWQDQSIRGFRFSYKKGDCLWLFSNCYEKYIKVDIVNKSLSVHSFSNNQEHFFLPYENMRQAEKNLYLFEMQGRGLYKCNEDFEKIEKIQFGMKREILYEYFDKRKEIRVVFENAVVSDLNWLFWSLQHERDVEVDIRANIGKAIFEKCIEWM